MKGRSSLQIRSLTKGTEQLNESKAETKALAAERKTLDKQYSTKKKSLEKLANSRDKVKPPRQGPT